MEIFDSHAHYNDAAFAADRDAVLSALPEKGVVGVVNAADSLESIPACLDLAARYPFVYAAVGVHPEAAATVDAATLPEKLLPFLSEKKVVAIGEIGLDYHYEDACPREKQLAVFAAQLRFAVEKDLPVIVHDRDAHADTLQLLTRYRPRGVVHCFSGSVEMLRAVTALGMYVGLGGATTFKNAKKPLAAAAAVPADRLLVETDAPYMAPTPHRGERCNSAMIAYVLETIAAVRGVSADALAAETAQNARTLFHIS